MEYNSTKYFVLKGKFERMNNLKKFVIITIIESPILNCIGVNLIGIFWFQCWVWLQNEVVLISTTHYLTNLIVNVGQPQQPSVETDWNGSQPSSQIAKFMGPTWGPPGPCRPQMGPMLAPWTLLSGVAATLGEVCLAVWGFRTTCFLLNHFAFSIILGGHHDTYYASKYLCLL